MLDPYRRVLSRPGAALFSATGLVARMPISMMTLAVVLLVTAETGSYTLAGQVSAAFVIANALFAIPHGTLLDRLGQSRVLFVDSLVFAFGSGMLGYAVVHDSPSPWPHLAAVVAGLAMPQIGSSVRARWTYLLLDPHEKQTAFALESVADEAVFMSGPTLVTFLATLWDPIAGLAAAVVLGTVGTIGLAAQRATQPPAHPRSPDPALRAPMPWLRLAPMALGGAALGSLFGATEVATVAFAEENAHTAVSGVLLAIWALGSLLSGVLTGTVAWKVTTIRRFRVGALALTLSMAPTPFVPNLWTMGVLLFVAGFAISPTIIALFSAIEEIAPRSRLSEALGLLQTGLGAGIAPGAALAGLLIDDHGSAPAYGVAVLSGAVAVLSGLLAADRGRAAEADEPGASILRP
jgi:MFS family permease